MAEGLRLALVALLVPDYAPALAFFCDGLGFACTADRDEGRKRWVTIEPPGGGAGFVLARAEGAAQQAAIGAQTGGRVFLFLQTDDFARDAARIKAAGGYFEEELRHEAYGIVAVWRDPFGNRWDLIEPIKAA